MKHFRMKIGAAALIATAALAGCSGRDEGGNTNNDDAGCTGACSTDAGGNPGTDGGGNPGIDAGNNDGGTTITDSGFPPDTDAGSDAGTQPNGCPLPDAEGHGPIGAVKINSGEGVRYQFDNLVVTGVDYASNLNADGGVSVQVWVIDPCFPKEGIYIDRHSGNPNDTYLPAVGDVVTVDGLFRHYTPNGSDSPTSRLSYRAVLKDNYKLQGVTGGITVTKTGTMTPPPADNEVPAGFGGSDGGSIKANEDFEGARVFLPGPITITNPRPLALKAYPNSPKNGLYYGFEVTGGVLVLNQETYKNCDWRAVAADGGTVTFNQGIRGVWDTYTLVQAVDGGTLPDGGVRTNYLPGIIPGTLEDGGVGAVNDYTYVLHPLNCDVDLALGDAGTPPADDAGTPPVDDAGTTADAGTPVDDAGTPPVDDAGTPVDDGGVTIVDAG